ncbi:hypothetical protein D621_19160 [beta proteobacterium AAP51]|nr:hypothetical protein D621_19160 [beta proteobacterium AAP51]
MLALHVLLLAGAWWLQPGQERGPALPAPVQAPLIVWLPGAPKPAAPAQRQAEAAEASKATAAPRARATTEPQAITLPASPTAAGLGSEASAQAALPATAAAPASASVPAAPAAPLNLALPRGASAPWRARNPALTDPRSNTPPPTVESGIAQALGGADQIEQFVMADGSVRFKRGNSCVIARPNRAGALDPFNASAQIRPRLLDRC